MTTLQSTMQSPGQSTVQSAPTFTTDDARAIAEQQYGRKGSITQLASERDQNFLVRLPRGEQFVLKIANAEERAELLDLQAATLVHIQAESQLQTALLCPTLGGEPRATVTGPNGRTHYVRLLTYLPGRPLATVVPHSPSLLEELGHYLGKLDRALATFQHPAAKRHLQWDLQHAVAVINRHRAAIADPQRQQLVDALLAHFTTHTQPLLPTLRTSIIHNDANDYNVLVDGGAKGMVTPTISGIIDFGDMVESYTVAEPAIAAAYAMLGKADPLAAAAAVVRGYHAAHPLAENELAALYPLITMRLCMSVCIAAHQQTLQPTNAYLTISETPAWALLEKLATIPPDLAHYQLRAACGLPPVPHHDAIVDWLRRNRDRFAAVVAQDLRTEPCHVFDLSVGSPLVADLADPADPAAFTVRIFAEMRQANVAVGVGRYNEARLLYTAPSFVEPSDEQPARRTVHLGIDLFQPAGAPIFAPLAGAVHSYADNRGEQDYGPTIILQHTIPAADLPDGSEPLTFYTLYGHLSRESLHNLYPGKLIAEGEQFATIGDYPINGNWPPHLHIQIITDLLGGSCGFPGVADPRERATWLNLSPDPNLILQIPDAAWPPAEPSKQALLAKRHTHLGPNLSISYSEPLHIVRARQQFLYDVDGHAYLDVVNNVCHVGHCHPHVVRAAQRQMAVLNTNTRYLYANLTAYAERLAATLPDPLSVCFFVNSGSEANDLALRLARAYTGRRDLICLDVAYHGNLQTLIEISPYKFAGPGGQAAPPTTHVAPMPDPYRGRYRGQSREIGQQYAAHVEELCTEIANAGGGVAAFIAESVLGCGGQIVLPPGYLAAAHDAVRAAGGLCIADEVQVGFGRVGSHFWGFETQGVVPDIVTLGKPIGNGHPMAAVVTTAEIAAAFANGMEYFNTFGGNPVSCAVGMAVLDVIEQEGLQAHAHTVGNQLMAGLRELMASYPLIGDVRGLGLFIGAELVLDRETKEPAPIHAAHIANRMRDHGILISTDGPDHNVLKLKPPLAFTSADATRLVTTLAKILQEDAVQL